MKIFYLLFSGIAGLSLFVSPAFASFQPGEMTLTPQVGYYLTNGYRDLDSALLTGIGLDFRISQPLSVEAFVGKTLGTAATLSQARLEGLSHLGVDKTGPPQRFIPYNALGVGLNLIDFDDQQSAANLLVAAGGGIKYLLSDNWMLLRLDGRLIASGGKVASMLTLGLCFPFGANQFEQPLGYIEKKEPVVVVAKSKTKNKAKVGA
ncbi:MAG: porin family protein, partial [Desulfuromonadaceae bacterium]|nr:porin family protein [Desulfuromonadaceae bacterium]